MREQWAAFMKWWTNRPPALRRWTRVTRTRAVAAGVFLIGVPAFFAVFPSWSDWNVWVRSAILAVWVIVALGAVAASLDADEIVKRLSKVHAEEESRLRESAVRVIMKALVRPGTQGLPEHFDEFTVYVYSNEAGRLEPWYPKKDLRGEEDPRVFAPGNGATGAAWDSETSEIIVVRGSEVANGVYGLSEAQQTYYASYETVASVALMGVRGKVGVLTVLSREDDSFFESDGGQHCFRALAETIEVVLKTLVRSSNL